MLKHIITIACFSVLLPLLIGIKNFSIYGRDRKVMTIYMLCSAIVGITTYYFWYRQINNLPLLHIYTIIEFIFLSYIYSFHITTVLPRKAILAVVLLFVAFSLYNSFFVQSVFRFNSYARGVEFILVLFYSITFVYALFIRNNMTPLRNMHMFWFNTGVLLYYTTSFFVFLLSNNMLIDLSKSAIHTSWIFHGVFLLIYHLFLSVALWIPKE